MMWVYRQIETRRAVKFGLTKDSVLAIKWYMKSLERCLEDEDTHFQNLLLSHIGRAFLDDRIKEYKKAYDCLSQASCEISEALFYLAWMYERGLYVKRSRRKAEYYFDRILENKEFEDDVFYDAAAEIKYWWRNGAPEEYIQMIVDGLG